MADKKEKPVVEDSGRKSGQEDVAEAHQKARSAGMAAQREFARIRSERDEAYNEELARVKAEGGTHRDVDGKFRK